METGKEQNVADHPDALPGSGVSECPQFETTIGLEEEGADVRRVHANDGGADQVEAGAYGAYIDDIER